MWSTILERRVFRNRKWSAICKSTPRIHFCVNGNWQAQTRASRKQGMSCNSSRPTRYENDHLTFFRYRAIADSECNHDIAGCRSVAHRRFNSSNTVSVLMLTRLIFFISLPIYIHVKNNIHACFEFSPQLIIAQKSSLFCLGAFRAPTSTLNNSMWTHRNNILSTGQFTLMLSHQYPSLF